MNMKKKRLSLSSADLPDFIVWEPGMEFVVDQPYLLGGVTLILELLAGDKRTGTDADGSPWESILPAHYGHILDTRGGDGEELDIYINAENPDWSGDVYIIDQLNLQSGSWDEHKIMLAFPSVQEAESTYVKAFSDEKGVARLAACTTLTLDDFLAWVYCGDTQSAIAPQNFEKEVRTTAATQALGDAVVKTPTPIIPGRFGGIPVQLGNAQALTIIDESTAENLRYSVYLFGDLDVGSRLRPVCNDLVRLLKALPENAQVDFYISSRGGDLLEAMRIASAIRLSRANVFTHAVGPVCSAAVVIWAEGHDRRIGDCAFFMQHMSSHGQFGKSTEILQRSMTIVNYVRSVVLRRQMEIGLWTEQEVSDLVDKSRDLYISADIARQRTEK